VAVNEVPEFSELLSCSYVVHTLTVASVCVYGPGEYNEYWRQWIPRTPADGPELGQPGGKRWYITCRIGSGTKWPQTQQGTARAHEVATHRRTTRDREPDLKVSVRSVAKRLVTPTLRAVPQLLATWTGQVS
jgi:hypothetical protein